MQLGTVHTSLVQFVKLFPLPVKPRAGGAGQTTLVCRSLVRQEQEQEREQEREKEKE